MLHPQIHLQLLVKAEIVPFVCSYEILVPAEFPVPAYAVVFLFSPTLTFPFFWRSDGY
jgi:hypothetical protein